MKSRTLGIALIGLALSGSLRSNPNEEPSFRIPLETIHRYQVSVYRELVESTYMDRIRLKGKMDFIYEPIADMVWHQEHLQASAAFYNLLQPRLRYEVTSFEKNFEGDFGIRTVEAYLRGRQRQLVDADFELLLAPEVTKGPARFRIFGQRAYSFTYAFNRGEARVVRGENWVEIDGSIYVVAIEAPNPIVFEPFFERVRLAMNSMRFFDDD